MAVTVGSLVKIPDLRLTLVAGKRGASKPVSRVHMTELEDPTPWLRGGELLLTAGIGIARSPGRQRAFVERLARANVAGLAVGLGPASPKAARAVRLDTSRRWWLSRVPKAVREAADRLDFPVLEIPLDIPFEAIAEMALRLIWGEDTTELYRALQLQGTLTHTVANRYGMESVVSRLATATGGWAAVLDSEDRILALEPATSRAQARGVLARLTASPNGLRLDPSFRDGPTHIATRPLEIGGGVGGYLVVGKGEALTQFDNLVLPHVAWLLVIEMERLAAKEEDEMRARTTAFNELASGSLTPHEAAGRLREHGLEPAGDDVIVLAAWAPVRPERLARAANDLLRESGEATLPAIQGDLVFILAKPQVAAALERLHRGMSERLGAPAVVAAGGRASVPDIGRSMREARYALEICRQEGRPIGDLESLRTYGFLFSLQDRDALSVFADSVLGPVDQHGESWGTELLQSLDVFLRSNAKWETAAAELHVHRHTLRYRIRLLEKLTGRDLSSAHDRVTFWLALRVRELLHTPGA